MQSQIQCYNEIITQKSAWEEAVRVTSQHKAQIVEFFDGTKPSEVFFIGCTSPYYAGVAASAFWRMETGIQARAVPSSELVLYPSLYYSGLRSNPVLIALSRSGKTTETTWAMEEFERRYPGRTILITCNPESPMTALAKLTIRLPESDEKTIPQTRSLGAMFISSLLVEAYYSGLVDVVNILEQSPSRVDRIIQNSDEVVRSMFAAKRYNNIFILGGGPLYGIAHEIGLKCMEMSGADTFSYTFLETRHGPRALIDENSLVVGLYSHSGLDYEADLMDELTTNHGATTLAIVPHAGWKTGRVSTAISVDCEWPDGLIGLAYLPAGQLVAFHHAISKGLNPDVARRHTQFVQIVRH